MMEKDFYFGQNSFGLFKYFVGLSKPFFLWRSINYMQASDTQFLNSVGVEFLQADFIISFSELCVLYPSFSSKFILLMNIIFEINFLKFYCVHYLFIR